MKRIFLIAFFLFPVSLLAQDWHWQNPLPQGNRLGGIHVFDETTAITVGAAGTVLKTTDGGTTWTPQTSGTTHDLASVFFIDASTGWVAGTVGTILHTTNGGETWTAQTSGTSYDLSCVFFIDANTGWASGGRYSPSGSTIRHTTNGGASWTTQASGTPDWLYSVFFIDASTGWAVGENGTIIHTSNGGTNWTFQIEGDSRCLYSVFFTDPDTGWAVGHSGSIRHTTNGGTTWTAQTSGTTDRLRSVFFTDAYTGWAVGGRDNPSSSSILHTTNGGEDWSAQSSGVTKHLYSVVFTDPNKGWVVGEAGTILHTNDLGVNWTALSSGTTNQLSSVFFTDASTGGSVGDLGTMLHTTNSGGIWTAQSAGGRRLHSSFFTDPNTGWTVGDLGTILHTTNGGTTMTAQTSGTTNALWSVSFTDASTGWAVGGIGTILHTTDGGVTWITQSSGATNQLSSVNFTDPNTGWAVGDAGTILHTSNGGETWTAQASGITNHFSSVIFTDANTGWAVGDDGTILHTTNGGTTWTVQTSGTVNQLTSVIFADANTGYAVGDTGTILRTTDGGTTWSAQTSGTTNQFSSVSFTDANTGWAVGSSGTILHTTTGGTGVEPPAATTLVSPEDGSTVSTSPLLTWNPAVGANWYTLQVSGSPYFITYVVNQTNITATSSQLSGLEEETAYYWRVSLTDDAGTSGWSETWNFTTGSVPNQVALVAPADGALVTSDSAVFVWHQSTPLADHYWLEAATDSLFTTPFIDSLVTDTVRTLTPLIHNQTYWWRVRAQNPFGTGPFSEARSFFVYQQIPSPPVLLSPDNGATGVSTNPTLSWNSSAGAESHAVQLSDTVDFSRYIVDEDSLAETSLDVAGLPLDATYYWRARAANALGSSGWSEVWSFTTVLSLPSQVVLVSPANSATIEEDSVRFQWSPGEPEIDRYWLEYSTDSAFTAATTDSSLSDTTTVVHNLQYNETYYWRVRAHNASGWGPSGAVWSFFIMGTAPGAPLLVSPPDGVTGQPLSVTFMWHTVSSALLRQVRGDVVRGRDEFQMDGSTDTVWYHLQLALDPGFDNLLVNDSTLVDTTAGVSSLSWNTVYYWRVRARNSAGAGPWSGEWNFATLTTPAQVVLAMPEDGAIIGDVSTVCSWFPSAPEVDRYWFQWSRDSAFAISRIDSAVTDTTTIASQLHTGTYYWKIRAHNEAGWGEFSEVWSFAVVITSVGDEEQIPAVYSLSQNYPNPFNPSTTIKYGLPKQAHVTLEVFNMLGQRVTMLVDEAQEAGYHEVKFDGATLASGLYLYRLQSGDFVETRKFVLLK